MSTRSDAVARSSAVRSSVPGRRRRRRHPPASCHRCRGRRSVTTPRRRRDVGPHHDLDELGHPVGGQRRRQRRRRLRPTPSASQRWTAASWAWCRATAPGRVRRWIGPPRPAGCVGPGLAQRAEQAVGAPAEPRQQVVVGRQRGQRAARALVGVLGPHVLRTSTTAPCRCGAPGRAPPTSGWSGRGRRGRTSPPRRRGGGSAPRWRRRRRRSRSRARPLGRHAHGALIKQLATQIRRQGLGQHHGPVILAPVLDQGRPDPRPRQRRAVDGVHELQRPAAGRAEAHVGPAGLVVAEPAHRGDLEPTIDAGGVHLEVERAGRRPAEVARAQIEDAVGQFELLEHRLGTPQDVGLRLQRVVRRAVREQLDLVELVHPQQAPRVAPGRARLTPVTRRRRGEAERELRSPRGSRPGAST